MDSNVFTAVSTKLFTALHANISLNISLLGVAWKCLTQLLSVDMLDTPLEVTCLCF